MSQEKEAEVSPAGLVVIKLIGLECHRRKRPKSALREKEAEVSPVGLVVIKLIGLECHRRKRPKSALRVWS
ncbi:hypothetical protein RRG08_000351 [Elysia crispata]|uniref:Uncharacterized protein n=1 Tax=Elysia crispata TaxID=231223 RepID=A0AAE0ZUU4_9GAST|nr:hypothetical protein RRG08_000351 [Elysia crispata]